MIDVQAQLDQDWQDAHDRAHATARIRCAAHHAELSSKACARRWAVANAPEIRRTKAQARRGGIDRGLVRDSGCRGCAVGARQ